MTQTNISRRAALGGAAIVGLLATTGAAAAMPAGISPALEKAFRALADARAASDQFYKQVQSPRLGAYEKARAAVPHRETTRTFVNAFGNVRSMATDNEAVVATARKILEWPDIDTGDHDRDWVAVQQEVVELADQRAAELQRLHREYRVNELAVQDAALNSACNQAYDAIIETPSQSFADLLAKLKFMEEEDEFNEWAHGLITPDIRRLAGGA